MFLKGVESVKPVVELAHGVFAGSYFQCFGEVSQLGALWQVIASHEGEVIFLVKKTINQECLAHTSPAIHDDQLRAVGIHTSLKFGKLPFPAYYLIVYHIEVDFIINYYLRANIRHFS